MQENTKKKKIWNVVVQTYSQMTFIIITIIIKAIKWDFKSPDATLFFFVWTHALQTSPPEIYGT